MTLKFNDSEYGVMFDPNIILYQWNEKWKCVVMKLCVVDIYRSILLTLYTICFMGGYINNKAHNRIACRIMYVHQTEMRYCPAGIQKHINLHFKLYSDF